MSGHRKGPWVAEMEPPAGDIWPANICQLGYGIWVREARGIPDDIPSEEEDRANACLIAAAPNLYRELHALVVALEAALNRGEIQVPGLATLNAARLALAKAEGRE